jgi:hypothetical protein
MGGSTAVPVWEWVAVQQCQFGNGWQYSSARLGMGGSTAVPVWEWVAVQQCQFGGAKFEGKYQIS